MIIFKITTDLLNYIRADLHRRHRFASERVGFIEAGLALSATGCTLLAHTYQAVEDEDYIDNPAYGAMMGPEAIRKAMARAYADKVALFHVHTHGGSGVPRFSGVDLSENPKFVPDFFRVRPERPHGALVLSNTHAYGQIWLDRKANPRVIDTFKTVGVHCCKWSVL